MRKSNLSYFVSLFLFVTVLSNSCSLRSEDVINEWFKLSAKRDYYNFDKTYVLGTKKLRDKNPKSLLAHIAYLDARRKVKAVIAEYESLYEKNKTPFYEYLKLRAAFGDLTYRQEGKKKVLADKLHQIVIDNKSLREEGLYDLCSSWGLLKDKKKKRAYIDELVALRPKYRPYKVLLAKNLEPMKEAKRIIELCEEGLKEKDPLFRSCSQIADLNDQNAKDLLSKRDELLKIIVEKALKNQTYRDKAWPQVYRFLSQLKEGEEGKNYEALLDQFIAEALKKDPKWLPYEYYKRYFDNLTYEEFETLDGIGKISKQLNFKKVMEDFDGLLKSNPTPQVKAYIYSNMAYVHMNPANKDHEKAFKYLIQSNELKPLGGYGTTNLLKLIIELKKDPDIGLMIIEDRLKEQLKKSIKHGLGNGGDALGHIKEVKEEFASLFSFQGQLYLLKGSQSDAKLAFLNSYQIDETEKAAFFLGKLYQEENPLIAIELLTQSLKYTNPDMPLGESLAKERDDLLTKLTETYLRPGLTGKELVSQYNDQKSGGDEKLDIHPYVGKELVKADVLDFKGGNYDWNRLKGKNVIVSFWATWCTPCFQEMAVLKKIQKEGKLKDLHIVGICTDGIEQKKKVKKILKEGGIEFDIVLDDGTFKDKYLVSAIPSMFFLDKAGKFIKQKTGYSPKLEEEIFKIFK